MTAWFENDGGPNFKALLTKGRPLTYDDSETTLVKYAFTLDTVKKLVKESKDSDYPKFIGIEVWGRDGKYVVRLTRTRGKRRTGLKNKYDEDGNWKRYPDRWVGKAFGRTIK